MPLRRTQVPAPRAHSAASAVQQFGVTCDYPALMSSIFKRAFNVARANITPAVERGLRSAAGGVRRATQGGAAGDASAGSAGRSTGTNNGTTGASRGAPGGTGMRDAGARFADRLDAMSRGSARRRPSGFPGNIPGLGGTGDLGSAKPGGGRAKGDAASGRASRTGRDGKTIHAGPAKVRTVEVGGVPVTTRTIPYDVARLGLPPLSYRPERDGDADPGEVVWTWIPYDDDPTQGKDRPALVLAATARGLVCLQLTSRDRARGSVTHDEYGRVWADIGSGAWDREGRPSEVRLDRLWLVQPQDVRREGAALDRERFADVAQKLRHLHG